MVYPVGLTKTLVLFSITTLPVLTVFQPTLVPRCTLTLFICVFLLYGNFNTFTKRTRKKLKVYTLNTTGTITLNLECGILTVEGISTAKFIQFYTMSTKLCICENCGIVLPVNMLTVWHAGFLGSTTHYHVS